MEIVVLTAGTFDLLHVGHINILQRAKDMGDKLIVMLSTDEFNEKKGKQAVQLYEDRKTVLERIDLVDIVVPEERWEDKEMYIKMFGVDLFTIGDDWKGKFDKLPCEVVYIPRTKGISTTKIIKKINEGNY